MSIFFLLLPLSSFVLSFALLALLRWRAYEPLVRLARRTASLASVPSPSSSLPAAASEARLLPPLVSVVVPSKDDGRWVERNLPYWLGQNYERFEVIVADASSPDDETAHAVKRLQSEHPRLRYTFVPQSSRHIVTRKLALTLGIRAARAPWVVLTNPECAPQSRDWLSRMASHFDEHTDAVLGYANYDDAEGAPGRRAVMQRARRFAAQATAALTGRAVGGDACNLALRREWFLEQGGFADSLHLPYGECTLLLDGRARVGRVAVEVHREAFVRLPLPDADVLRNRRQRTSRLFARLAGRHRWVFVRDAWASVALYGAWLSLALYAGMRAWQFGGDWSVLAAWGCPAPLPYGWIDLLTDLLAATGAVGLIWGSVASARRWLRVLDETNFGAYILLYELLLPWRRSR